MWSVTGIGLNVVPSSSETPTVTFEPIATAFMK
jgi:hypothetical protein